MTLKTLATGLLIRFVEIVGEANALIRAEDQAGYLTEWRDRFTGKTPVVLRPNSTEQVSRILALANEHGIGVVPQGGNTGLVGGQIPSPAGDEIVLSLSRMTKIRGTDADAGTLTAEAGVPLAAVQKAADDAGWLFPLSLASEGSAQIGGVLATNAGGTAVLSYGNARNMTLGLEAVLADGRVWHGLRALKKDNTGYDLRDLLIGSEGTLAVITAAVLKLAPKPAEYATALVALASPAAALSLFKTASATGGASLTTFEFWSRRAHEFGLAVLNGRRDPFASSHRWYALLEFSSGEAGGAASRMLEAALLKASGECVVDDALIAASLTQRNEFWGLRESLSEAQKPQGASIKHDVSVPVARIPEFLERADRVVENVCAGARPVPFGHFGDGNVHYNVTQPASMAAGDFLALWEPMSDAVHELVHSMDGSISAEHGIGQMKRHDLLRYKSEVEIAMMRDIKKALDPKGILNPGKVLDRCQ